MLSQILAHITDRPYNRTCIYIHMYSTYTQALKTVTENKPILCPPPPGRLDPCTREKNIGEYWGAFKGILPYLNIEC